MSAPQAVAGSDDGRIGGVTLHVPVPRGLWRRVRLASRAEARPWRDFVGEALQEYLRRRSRRNAAKSLPRSASKRCFRCQKLLQLSAFRGGGKDSYCIPCRRAYTRAWRVGHAEEINARQRERYAEDQETARRYFRNYHQRRTALIRAGKWKPRDSRT